MATNAAQAGLGVRRPFKIRMHSRVASQTGRVRFTCGRLTRQENLGDVSATFYVRLPRSMAALAGDPLSAVHQGKLRMRIIREALADLCVTSDARIGAHIAGRSCSGRWGSLWCAGLLARFTRGIRPPGIPESGECDHQRDT